MTEKSNPNSPAKSFTKAEREALLHDFQQSELNYTDFAKAHDIARSTFYKWVQRYVYGDVKYDGQVQLKLQQAATVPQTKSELGSTSMEIRFESGLAIRFQQYPSLMELLPFINGLRICK